LGRDWIGLGRWPVSSHGIGLGWFDENRPMKNYERGRKNVKL